MEYYKIIWNVYVIVHCDEEAKATNKQEKWNNSTHQK